MRLIVNAGRFHGLLGALVAVAWLPACSSLSTKEVPGGSASELGRYAPPPAGAAKLRVRISALKCEGSAAEELRASAEIAADQLATLAVLSGRFELVEDGFGPAAGVQSSTAGAADYLLKGHVMGCGTGHRLHPR